MTRKQRRKLEAEREDAEDADDGPDSDADVEVFIFLATFYLVKNCLHHKAGCCNFFRALH